MRNMEKAIADYRSYRDRTNRGHFLTSDIEQIYALSADEYGRLSSFELVGNALHAGFAIGYRAAKADVKKK
ncbi:MAG: hypothetical protein K6B42_03130 [Clostridia bacterium]|nr:hypothetical protein [Clostridia bacterium]